MSGLTDAFCAKYRKWCTSGRSPLEHIAPTCHSHILGPFPRHDKSPQPDWSDPIAHINVVTYVTFMMLRYIGSLNNMMHGQISWWSINKSKELKPSPWEQPAPGQIHKEEPIVPNTEGATSRTACSTCSTLIRWKLVKVLVEFQLAETQMSARETPLTHSTFIKHRLQKV